MRLFSPMQKAKFRAVFACVALVLAAIGSNSLVAPTVTARAQGQGQNRLVPYKDVGWSPPAGGEPIMAKIKSENSFFAKMGTLFLARVANGSLVTSADEIFVINQNDQLPGFKASLEAGRLAIESLGGKPAGVKITSLDERGFVHVGGFSVVLPVGTEFEIEKMHWQDADFDKGFITLRADGLEWRPRTTTAVGDVPARALASFDGQYIGPADVEPSAGTCHPIAGIMLTIEKKNAEILARRVVVTGAARYVADTTYRGAVSEAGDVTVVASEQKWSGSGSVSGDTFRGTINNGDAMQQSGGYVATSWNCIDGRSPKKSATIW
jgi:hypothetical protein